MALELQRLRQVIALAEHGSFVRAAAVLYISQPALSRSIQNLERDVGSALFQRSSSGVVPTDLGRVYIERARDLLRMADEFESHAIGDATMRSGRVGLGGGPYPTESFLGPAVARFVSEHPRISLQLQMGNWDDLLLLLRSRRLDFFVAETSVLELEPDLDVVTLPERHPVYFVARAGHPLAARAPVRVAEALEWPLATPSRIPPRILTPMLSIVRAQAARSGPPRSVPAIECNGLSPLKRIVTTSDVVTASILPCIREELESGEFVLLAHEPWLFVQYGLVSLRGRPMTSAAARLREHVLAAEREATALEARLCAKYTRRGPGRKAAQAQRTERRR